MNILVVSPSFPPDKSVGTVRIVSLVNYLKRNNHNITILTRRKKCKLNSDFEIIQIDESDIMENGLLSKLKLFHFNQKIYSNMIKKILSERKFDFVIITGGPFYTFPCSKSIKKFSVPCLLDFRDPWTLDVRGLKDLLSPKRIAFRIIYYPLESIAIHNSSLVTTVTSGWVDLFKNFHPFSRRKINLVENGFDESRIILDSSVEKPVIKEKSGLDLYVFGKLFYYSEYYSNIFLKAVSETKDFNIKIFQIGDREENADKLLHNNGLSEDKLESSGFCEYEEGICKLKKADAFIMIDSRLRALGTKVYDYINIGKPIIFIGPKKSAFASLISKFEYGFICSSIEEVREAFVKVNNIDCIMTTENRMSFSREIQNKKMEKLLIEYLDNLS